MGADLSLDDPAQLLPRWRALWTRLGARGDGTATGDMLLARYGEPHRAYHTLAHLAHCLETLDTARDLAERPDEVEAALWFHDAVYDPRAIDNEARSAELAAATLRPAGVAADRIGRIEALVLVTRHAEPPPKEPDATLVSDVDLSILGADAASFARYEDAIRVEYAWMPAPAFRTGRRAILSAFLARPLIYATERFRERYEERARANLRAALASPGRAG